MKTSPYLFTCGLMLAIGCSPSAVTNTNNATVETAAQNESTAPTPEAKPTTPQEQFETVKSEYDDAYQTFVTAYRSATDDEGRQDARKLMPKADDYAGRISKIAEANPETETAVDALVWVSSSLRGADGEAATSKLLESYSSNPKVAPIVMMLSYGGPAGTEERLRGLLENESEPVQAAAKYALGSILIKKDHTSAEAIELLQSVVDDFSETEIKFGERGIKIAPEAEGELTEATKLQVGMVAPDIEGADLDGVEFKLSEYRGKVVVLDFWGNW